MLSKTACHPGAAGDHGSQRRSPPRRLPFHPLPHLNVMRLDTKFRTTTLPPFRLRTPAEPMPPPIKEPPSPMENPDAPVREPDPEEPEQI
ncbi:MAG: hypothetical protein WAM04_16670 [Candidatus Sulfotelmatobacter sp.]